MKKGLRKMFAAVMMFAMLFSTKIGTNKAIAATEDYLVFIALGADSTAEGASWDVQYYGPDASSNAGDVQAVTATVKNGETATVSLTVPEIKQTWFLAPCIVVGDTVVDASSTFDVKVSIDGTDVTDTIDMGAGKAFWNEGTGDYSETQIIRLAGGYNEWGDKYMTTGPSGFTKIEYTITLNIIEGVAGGEAAAVPSTSEYPAFIALGADSKAEGATWDIQYYGENASSNSGDVIATNGVLKNGETTTISLKVPEVNYTWFLSPCINTNGDKFDEGSTFDVKVAINGTDVTDSISFDAGKAFWNEGTGELTEDTCVRLAGGYNEWGDHYMTESPKDFTEISFTITPNILIGGGTEEPANDLPPVDLDGVYHAYLGVQTPIYQFRNSFDDASYGLATDYFNQLTGWVDNEATAMPGTLTDAEIAGNGTYRVSVEGFDFTNDFAEADAFNLLFLSTDIPLNDQVKITNVNILMDGKSVYTFDEAFPDPDSKTYMKALAVNMYNSEIPSFSYKIPTKNVTIEFTVSGFNYDAEVEATPTPEPTATPTVAPTTAPTEAAQTTAPVEDGETNVGLIVGIVIAVLAVAVIVVVVIMKKKKEN